LNFAADQYRNRARHGLAIRLAVSLPAAGARDEAGNYHRIAIFQPSGRRIGGLEKDRCLKARFALSKRII